MKDFFENWLDGLELLVEDDLVSFYTFFTLALAECVYLWIYWPLAICIPFIIQRILYIANILICAYCKRSYDIRRVYLATTILIFLLGLIFNVWLNIILTLVPFLITFLWIKIREYQDSTFCYEPELCIQRIIVKLFENKIFWLFSQIIVVGLPYILLVVLVAMIPGLSIIFKLLIPIIYLIIAPMLSLLEDELVAEDIFEIAFERCC